VCHFVFLNAYHYAKIGALAGGVLMNEIGDPFSIREREILTLLGQGKTSKEIAVSLDLSVTTISTHRRNICRKLGVHSTAELIRYAVSRTHLAARG
jgi:DNA-binding CsgD family transcriptional regulator